MSGANSNSYSSNTAGTSSSSSGSSHNNTNQLTVLDVGGGGGGDHLVSSVAPNTSSASGATSSRGSGSSSQAINVLNPRKRFLNVSAVSAQLKRNRNAMEDVPMGDAPMAKHQAMDGADGPRQNFSALGSTNSNVINVAKTPNSATTAAKPGDIRKLVIKNFKSKLQHLPFDSSSPVRHNLTVLGLIRPRVFG